MKSNLQESTIKSIFSDFDHDDQVNLICELMKIARVDSVIQQDRIIKVAGAEVGAAKDETEEAKRYRHYRQEFDGWLYDFLPRFIIVVEKDYLDRCFKFFELVLSKAIGFCNSPDGYAFCVRDDSCRIEPFQQDDKIASAMVLMGSESIQTNHLCCVVENTEVEGFSQWRMSFQDFFVLIYNRSDEEVNVLLLIMRFFGDDPERLASANQFLKVRYPYLVGEDQLIDNDNLLKLFSGLTLTPRNH
jgi:hypothetical protein